jgi:hypothetical protein
MRYQMMILVLLLSEREMLRILNNLLLTVKTKINCIVVKVHR